MLSLSKNLLEFLKNKVSKSITNETTKIKNEYTTKLNEKKNNIKTNENDMSVVYFRNFPPKIGFFNETVVDIQADFKNNLLPYGMYCVEDNQGFQNLYYTAYQSPFDITKRMYRAYRANTSDNFIYETQPIYFDVNGTQRTFRQIYAVGEDYIVGCYDSGNDKNSPMVLLNTNRSSNPKKWQVVAANFDNVKNGYKLIYNILWFKEYNSICIVGTKNYGTVCWQVWKLQSNINSCPTEKFNDVEINIKDMIVSNNSALVFTSWAWDKPHYGALFDGKNLLIIHAVYAQWTDGTGTKKNGYWRYLICADVKNKEYFKQSGSQGYTKGSMYTLEQNKLTQLANVHESTYCTFTYNQKSKKILACHRIHASSQVDFYEYNIENDFSTLTAGFFYNGKITQHIEPNDSAPWSKSIKAPICIDGHLHFQGLSKKYGWIYFWSNCNPEGTSTSDLKFEWKTDYQWYQSGTHGDTNLTWASTSALKNGNTLQTFYVKNNKPYLVTIKTEATVENGLKYAAQRILTDNSYPTAPNWEVANVTRRTSPYYFPNLFVWMGQMKNSTVGNNVPVIVTYDVSTKKWKIYDNVNQYMIDEAKIAKDQITGDTTFYLQSNFFKEGDKLYFRWSSQVQGTQRVWSVCDLNLSTGVYTQHTNLTLTNIWPGCPTSIGWTSKYGYYASSHYYTSNTSCYLYVTKVTYSHPSTGAKTTVDYGHTTMDAFLDKKQFYTITAYCEPTSSLVAYINETPIFLGGYYSVLPVSEIALTPNANNYVYLQRNADDHTKVDVFCTTTKGTIADNNFNSICVARIKTGSKSPIETEYYHFKNYKFLK